MLPPHIPELLRYEQELFGPEAWSEHGYRLELADRRYRHYVVALEDPAPVGPVRDERVPSEHGPGGGGPGGGGPGGDELIGWGGVLLLGDSAEILTVGVVPSARRRGVAGRLLDELEGHAVRHGAQEMFLEVRVDNAAAIALYLGRGYVQVGTRRGYYEHGRVDAMVMRRTWSPATPPATPCPPTHVIL